MSQSSLNILACHHCDQREQNCIGCKCKADPDGRPFIELAEAGACPLKRHGDGAKAFIELMKGKIVRQVATIPLPGDLIEAAAKRIGMDKLMRLWERWTGMPCNCEERRDKVNAATIRLMKWAGFKA